MAYVERRKNRFHIATRIIFLVLLVFEIYWLRDELLAAFKNQISWVSLITILGVLLLLVLWIRSPIKKMVGEGKGIIRSRFHFALNYVLVLLFILPFELYFLKGSLNPEIGDYLSGLSIIGISVTLAGVLLASAGISQITPYKRQELI